MIKNYEKMLKKRRKWTSIVKKFVENYRKLCKNLINRGKKGCNDDDSFFFRPLPKFGRDIEVRNLFNYAFIIFEFVAWHKIVQNLRKIICINIEIELKGRKEGVPKAISKKYWINNFKSTKIEFFRSCFTLGFLHNQTPWSNRVQSVISEIIEKTFWFHWKVWLNESSWNFVQWYRKYNTEQSQVAFFQLNAWFILYRLTKYWWSGQIWRGISAKLCDILQKSCVEMIKKASGIELISFCNCWDWNRNWSRQWAEFDLFLLTYTWG